nr:2-hydroxy-3-oxopropionate reductase [Ralstonia pickettii]
MNLCKRAENGRRLFERSEFASFPARLHKFKEGVAISGAPFFAYFLWQDKESESPPAGGEKGVDHQGPNHKPRTTNTSKPRRSLTMATATLNLGFIGLGIMGAPMAGHLRAAGHTLFVHDVNPAPAALVEAGVTVCTSAEEVAKRADIIFIMVPDTPHVEAVLFSEKGVAKALKDAGKDAAAGKIVVDMSSISPIATKDFASRINKTGAQYLDAPVSGGEVGAKAASLTIMVGGEQAAFDRVAPLFNLMGKNITLVGGNGDGQTTKVANQIIVALNIQAVSEALLFASKAGADPAKVRQALMGGFAASRILEVHGERMVKRTFDPGFRIELHQKDLNLALQGAKTLGVALPNTATAQELFNTCAANGMGKQDHSALCRAIEIMSNHDIA